MFLGKSFSILRLKVRLGFDLDKNVKKFDGVMPKLIIAESPIAAGASLGLMFFDGLNAANLVLFLVFVGFTFFGIWMLDREYERYFRYLKRRGLRDEAIDFFYTHKGGKV